jgi:nitrite reductase (NO-forming)
MTRIKIAAVADDERALGRPLMGDHNLSARLWATAAVLVVPLLDFIDQAYWLPVHLAMLGAASQAIVGGQLMFSTTLALARGPSRRQTLTQLGLLNVAAALVIGGRIWGSTAVLGVGASVLVVTIAWVTWQVRRLWRDSANRRFSITGTFYLLAGLSIIIGGSIGGALGIGAFDDPSSYLAHRDVHMAFNVLGWAGMTIVGTAVTLLPTIMHVRAPKLDAIRPVPWLMFGGLMVLATGASIDQPLIGGLGMVAYVLGLARFGLYVRAMLSIPRRRRVPTAALHLIAALGWCVVTSVALAAMLLLDDPSETRDLLVVGGAGGFVFQALLGAWSFLLPSTRPPDPERRRRELIAMEVGGRTQVIAFNVGLALVLGGLVTESDISHAGIVVLWSTALWTLAKTWTFPWIARLPSVGTRSRAWWAPPEQ